MLSLDIAATGMLAQQMHVDVISNNIANMTTTGYKRQRPEFQDLMYQNKIRPGSTSSDVGTVVPSGIQLGLGVRPGSVYRIMEQGSLQITSNEYDVAINGRGYFQITLPNGDTAYTRAGNFAINDQGNLVTSQGYLLQPNITIPEDATDVVINESGEVLTKQPGVTAFANQGQIQLALFTNEGGLDAIGGNLFLETTASSSPTTGNPQDSGFGSIQQGVRENSNVNVVEEITNLITAQRAYEMNSKVIKASDEMMSTANQLR